jgi:hypothetical protein
MLLRTLFGCSAFPLSLRNTCVAILLLKKFSSEFETEAEFILALLIKLIGGETDACEPQLAWAPEGLMMEIMRR